MLNKLFKISIGLLGIILGVGLIIILKFLNIISSNTFDSIGNYIYLASGLAIGIIFYIISPKIIKLVRKTIKKVENEFQKIPASDIFLGSIGLIVGLFIAYLISNLLLTIQIPYVGQIISIIIYLLFGYFGVTIPTKKREDFSALFTSSKRSIVKDKNTNIETIGSKPKILDTSVIIDGRIADICRTGFIEGPLVIPEFVLEELRHIADSSDSLKRNRGRRGLDILNLIQKEIDIAVIIYEKDFEDISEVDSKLLKLGQFLNGKVVTNDYNLNKVAEFHGVDVLNINELANAVKPIVLPGEVMIVQVVKDGKESGQGVAYLDDGTMIVVDNGRKYIGETIGVVVTSVLQTAAGRMIFAKPKSMVDKAV